MSPDSSVSELGLSEAANLFAALGDSTRLMIVERLCVGEPLSITRLSEGASVTRQAITKHLHALHEAGLVSDHRRGRERMWELAPDRLEIARRYLIDISRRWDATIDRLKAFVEEHD